MKTYPILQISITHFYRKFSRKKTLLLAGLGTAVFFATILYTSRQYLPVSAPGIISLQFCPTLEEFNSVIRQWGEAGITGYRDYMWLDYLFPAAYGIFFASLISILDSARTSIHPVFFFPLTASLLDWFENTIHLLVIGISGAPATGLVTFSFIISMAKWLLLLITALYILDRLLIQLKRGSLLNLFFG